MAEIADEGHAEFTAAATAESGNVVVCMVFDAQELRFTATPAKIFQLAAALRDAAEDARLQMPSPTSMGLGCEHSHVCCRNCRENKLR